MTHKEKLDICTKMDTNKKKIAEIQEMIANDESSGLDCRNRVLKAEVLELRMENAKCLVLLEAGISISGSSAFKMTLDTDEPEFEESFIENHAMDVLLVVLILVNIYIMMETWK
jgi:hypothetical protein